MPSLFVTDPNTGKLVPNNNVGSDVPTQGTGDTGQPNNSGVADTISTSHINSGEGGIGGLFGAKQDYQIYRPDTITDQNYSGDRQALTDRMTAIAGTPNRQLGPMAQSAGAQINTAPQNQFRDKQMQLGDALMAQANGQGPSVAGSQLQQSTEMNLQAAMAQAASSRGGNLGASQYQLGNARANIQQQAAQGLAQNRIQEQMTARAQLGDVLNSGRGADIGLATNQAGMDQQNNQFNAGQTNAGVLQQGQSDVNQDQFKQNLLTQLQNGQISMDQYNTQLAVQQNQFAAGQLNQATAAAHGIGVANSAQGIQLAGAVAGAIGAGVASDERLKTNIEDGDSHAKEFLDALASKYYSYKDEKYGEGPRMGIMAQDAEKSALGRSFVMNTPQGKMLDVNKALSAALSSVAHLNKRVNKLEH